MKTHVHAIAFTFLPLMLRLGSRSCGTSGMLPVILPLTDSEAIISAEPKMFSPWQMYFPSSALEAFRIRRLPSGRIAILKSIKKVCSCFIAK